MKEYTSFKDIDRDLELLKLRNEIDQEEVKLGIAHTKQSLSPISLLSSILGTIVQKILMIKVVARLTGIKMKS